MIAFICRSIAEVREKSTILVKLSRGAPADLGRILNAELSPQAFGLVNVLTL